MMMLRGLRPWTCLAAALLVIVPASWGLNAQQQVAFDVNDVAFLWPVPGTAEEVERLLGADALLADGKERLWPRQAFDEIIRTAQTVGVRGSTGNIHTISFGHLAKDFSEPKTWKVAAVRVDPCAPGCDDHDLVKETGFSPQIRLILQPITVRNQQVTVHDVTAHLVFSYTKGRATPFVPDRDAFDGVVQDLMALKLLASEHGVSTAGPLSVHPGLRGPRSAEFNEELTGFLRRRLSEQHLLAAAFMGLAPEPEPWIFFALKRDESGQFVPAPHPVLGMSNAQMFIIGGDSVMPPPRPSNLARATKTAAGRGVSTSLLFRTGAGERLHEPVFAGTKSPTLGDVPDLIANPQRSTFFNTDCVSCHSESARRRALGIATESPFRFSRPPGTSGVDPEVMPKEDWNVRNFGWFPSFFQQTAVPTATQRTANEAAESAHAINRDYLPRLRARGAAEAKQKETPMVQQPVANPLTLVMRIKSDSDFNDLKSLIEGMQALPADRNPIVSALDRIGTVHFARFVFIEERLLAVITTYDGSFERYINAFIDAIGGVFDKLLAHVENAPRLPVADNREEFLAFIKKHDLRAVPPFYSAYPDLLVRDILTLQRKAAADGRKE